MIGVFGLFFIQVLGALGNSRFSGRIYPIPYQYQNEDYARNEFNYMIPGQIQTYASKPSLPIALSVDQMSVAELENLLYMSMQEDPKYHPIIPPYPVLYNNPLDSQYQDQPNNFLPYYYPYGNDYVYNIFYPNRIHHSAATSSSVLTTVKPLPVITTSKPLPVITTSKPLPMITTSKPLPMITTSKPLPIITTSKPLPVKLNSTNMPESLTVENVHAKVKEKDPLVAELRRLIVDYCAEKSPNTKTNVTMTNTQTQSKDPLSEDLTQIMNECHRKKIRNTTEPSNQDEKNNYEVFDSSTTSISHTSHISHIPSTKNPSNMFGTTNHNIIVSTTPQNPIKKKFGTTGDKVIKFRLIDYDGIVSSTPHNPIKKNQSSDTFGTIGHNIIVSIMPQNLTKENQDYSEENVKNKTEDFRHLELNATDDEVIDGQDKLIDHAFNLTTCCNSNTTSLPESNQLSSTKQTTLGVQSKVTMEAETKTIEKLDSNSTNIKAIEITTTDASVNIYEKLFNHV